MFMLSRRWLIIGVLGLAVWLLVFAGYRTRPLPAAPPVSGSAVTTVGNPAGTDQDAFFADYRMRRDRALSLEASLLRDTVNNPQSTAEARQKARDQLLALGAEEARAVELEGLARAEGYADAVAFFENQGVTVVVGPAKGAMPSPARLVQVVARQAGVPPANVVVIQRP